MHTSRPADPFKVVKFAKLLHVSEKQAAIMVSLGLTLATTAFAMLASQPVRLLCQTIWPAPQPRESVAADPPLLQGVWDLLGRDFVSVTGCNIFIFVFAVCFYFAGCAPWAILDVLDLKWTRKFKIQNHAMPSAADLQGSLLYDVVVMFLISAPGLCVMWQRGGPWPYYSSDLCQQNCRGEDLFPLVAPSIPEVLLHLLACLYIFDFSYGCWHMLHHKSLPLYKHVHAFHHTYYMPFAFVTNYATVSELLVVSLLSLVLPPALGAHPLTHWIWVLASVQLSIEGHAGYDFPFLLGKWFLGGKLVGMCGPHSHDNHHKYPRKNFFPFLSWGDRFFGTELVP